MVCEKGEKVSKGDILFIDAFETIEWKDKFKTPTQNQYATDALQLTCVVCLWDKDEQGIYQSVQLSEV
jgi:hypothetical protein